MEQPVFYRWSRAACRAARNWYHDLTDKTGCRAVAYKNPETNDRAERIDSQCQNQRCELISLGRHGTPGEVQSVEKLYRVLLSPTDYDLSTQAILTSAATHTEGKGLSILRESAENAEFRMTAEELLAGNQGKSLIGIAELLCLDIRGLQNDADADRRLTGDRHYIVVDTDMPGLPNHADVFNTFPRPKLTDQSPSNKTIWRKERKKLLGLISANIISKSDFRDGLLADLP